LVDGLFDDVLNTNLRPLRFLVALLGLVLGSLLRT
jgi:hypothetical protein